MIKIDPNEIPIQKLHQTILGAVTPRPIAFASTIDKDGKPNLSPFSFYNAFGVNPTTLIFSPSRRGRDNTVKHTYENLKEVPEVVINTVTYDLVQQVNLSSTEYKKGVNEFIKSGLTPVLSEKIKPFRVKESPVQFECKVRDIIETGTGGSAANLVICEILMIHLNESILDEDGNIDPNKLDTVGRLGGDYYCRTSGSSMFKVQKPLQKLGIGIDQLPDHIKFSKSLNGNDLGKLGNIEALPTSTEINSYTKNVEHLSEEKLFDLAKKYLSEDKIMEALSILMVQKF
jgi:flavin reductase (DIM6/NTAB) family NADH-FMN oxidoreductase RutF